MWYLPGPGVGDALRSRSVATERIQAADTYAEMLFWANWADRQMVSILAMLERKIGSVEYEISEVLR